MARSIQRGIPLSEWEVMTVGMIFDYIIYLNNIYEDGEEVGTRQATQDDFDRY